MMSRHVRILLLAVVVVLATFLLARAADAQTDSTVVAVADADDEGAPVPEEKDEITYLVPELKDAGYSVAPGRKAYKNRLGFSPAIGQLGSETLFAFRLSYHPNNWLGYELALGHNPAESLHAMLHSFNVLLRYPIPWRAQPYITAGYGMMTVFPGKAINADPVSKNTLLAGGGLELYIRDDVAVRGEFRGATVLGQERDQEGTVAYQYREYTVGFVFYRSLGQ